MERRSFMRVLIVHNRYQQSGGEDNVVASEHKLLCQNGWEANLWSVSNDAIVGTRGKILAALRTPYSRQAKDQFAEVIKHYNPQIVHVHNFFPLLSPSIYDACRAAGVAVVQTLHNYRTICPAAILMRDNRPCEECIGGLPYRAVLHGCYRGSRIGSLPVARMVDLHRRRGTWSHKVDRFIALSKHAVTKFVAAGFPSDRIIVKPNFAWDTARPDRTNRDGALFVGRISPEKGVDTLLQAWRAIDAPLRMAGDGPSREIVERANRANIVTLGLRSSDEVAAEMARAAFLVAPSIWPETFGLVIVEAFCHGLPVIASRIGAFSELVENGRTGLLVAPGDPADLAAKVRWALEHPEEMRVLGANARREYEEKYSPAANLRQLTRVYDGAAERLHTFRPN